MRTVACALLLVLSGSTLHASDVIEASNSDVVEASNNDVVEASNNDVVEASNNDVVEASKAARAKRRKSTSRVITNADVKKSKGKISENKAPLTPIDTTPKASEIEQHETARLERIALEAKLAVLDSDIATLEAELVAIERKYFEENDPNVRDGAIAKQFREAQEKLGAKKKEREALSPRGPSDGAGEPE